jgi:hypothetical protein
MYKKIPQHDHGLHPGDILCPEDLQLVTRHFKATAEKSHDEIERAAKTFTPEERKRVSMALEAMRDCGFFPDGLDQYGGLRWAVQIKSDLQIMLEEQDDDFDGMSVEQLREQVKRNMQAACWKEHGQNGPEWAAV